MTEQILGRIMMSFTGDYDATKQYAFMDSVLYDGSTYICKADSVGIAPTDTSHWQLIAKGGDSSSISFLADVTKFGVVGDGTTDNTAALKKIADWSSKQGNQPTIFFPPGTYLWSDTVQFNEPVTLMGIDGAWLKYTGSNDGLILGQDGLTTSTYLGHCTYTVEHLGFTGGENSTHLIRFNNFITQSRVQYCRFHDAGGKNHGRITDFCIHFNADAWDARVEHCQFDVSSSGGQRQFVDMDEYGNSRVVVADNLITSLSGFGTAVYLNGANNQAIRNKIEGFQTNVRLGALAHQSVVAFNYFEKNGSSMPSAAVEIGNPNATTSASPRYIYIGHNYAGLHNKAGKMYSTLVGPSSDKALLRDILLDGNFVNAADYTAKPAVLGYLVRENNLSGQTGNRAVNNNLSQGYQGILDISTTDSVKNVREEWATSDSSGNQGIDSSEINVNKKPSEYSDGIFYEQKTIQTLRIDRTDYAKEAQDGTQGILTTKCVNHTARQEFELTDGSMPLTLVRTGTDDKWNDWHGVTNWN